MKTLNPNTKKAKAFINAYLSSRNYTLDFVYDNYSRNKERAFNECKQRFYDEKGAHLRIISANTFQFTCAWHVEKNLRVETKNNSYIIPNAF